MRGLLDVNVLIALLDAEHTLHGAAVKWFADHASHGWASSPITQNGCVRVMAHPGYPNSVPARVVIARLAEATATELHEFWPDDISLLDPRVADPRRIHGPRQITGLYLLALAVHHDARLVTFDDSIVRDAVIGATPRHLLRI